MTHEAGKGDTQRPTNHKSFSEGFDRIFGKRSEPYKTTCNRCGKELWLDPVDAYSGIHTCTPKESQSA
jgi:hypothetical protein